MDQVRRSWSPVASLVLAVFVVLGVAQLGGHHLVGAVVGFGLAVLYVPARALRGPLAKALRGDPR
jgi:hypothetical protein